ncbi:MAG: tRNA lysidine(34) synthetase TilS [Oribacterium sp.]
MDAALRVRKFIEERELIRSGDIVLLGLSGGADSVCLLSILSGLRERLSFSLHACHVQHGIRGEEAVRDLRFSREMAERFSVPFLWEQVDAPGYAGEKRIGIEEAARILRYRALREQLSALPGTGRRRIAVAHHRDDQAETVLHHLIRGSGLRGLRGMEAEREALIRPLLCINRAEILAELQKKGLPYIVDSSNEDIKYTRNHIRSLLSLLREDNARAAEHIAEAAELMGEADTLLREMAAAFTERHAVLHEGEELPAEVCRELRLPLPALRAQQPLLQRYILMEAVRRLDTPLQDWESVHFKALSALLGKAGGAHLDLPYQMSAEIRKKELLLRRNRETVSMKRRRKL